MLPGCTCLGGEAISRLLRSLFNVAADNRKGWLKSSAASWVYFSGTVTIDMRDSTFLIFSRSGLVLVFFDENHGGLQTGHFENSVVLMPGWLSRFQTVFLIFNGARFLRSSL